MANIDRNSEGHKRHVRWLAHQYALPMDRAEHEAMRRYEQYPSEIKRWGVGVNV